MANVLHMQDFPRTGRHDWEKDSEARGFSKALFLVHNMLPGSPRERQTAIENWVACGKLSQDEKATLYEFYGWERAP